MQIPPLEYAKVTSQTATSTANAAAAITLTADSDEFHVLHGIQYSYDGSATGSLTVAIDGTTVFTMDLSDQQGTIDLPMPIYGAKGEGMVITLGAGGSGVIGKLNVQTS